MNIDSFSQEILDELVRICDKLAIQLDKFSKKQGDIDETFRLAHTLKAAAHYAKTEDIGKAALYLEDILSGLKTSTIDLNDQACFWFEKSKNYFETISELAKTKTLPELLAMQEVLPTIEESFKKSLKDLKVLYVEDDDDVREAVARTLQNIVGEVVQVDNADDALYAFDNHNFDAVILDLNMPGKSGFWLAKEIKNQNANVNIIITTGHNEGVFKFQASQVGVTNYLTKPFGLKDLVALLTTK